MTLERSARPPLSAADRRMLLQASQGVVIDNGIVWNNPPAAPSGQAVLDEDEAFFAAVLEQVRTP